MARKILFIVNPNAGKKAPDRIIAIIGKEFPGNISYDIVIWEDPEHFEKISAQLLSGGYTDAVAAGGDGTVNQVAKVIVHTDISLGIIPVGSGNGLARSLGISMDPDEAIKQIVNGRTRKIDYGTMNNIPFFCTSGLGFDAHIGHLFSQSKDRGLKGYIKLVCSEIFSYKAQKYYLKFNGLVIQRRAFLITVANAGQYGNDFYIAPEARVDDGKFHVVVLNSFPFYKTPKLLYFILKRKAHKSSTVETYCTDELTILRGGPGSVHFDGEPNFQHEEIHYQIKPGALALIVGEAGSHLKKYF